MFPSFSSAAWLEYQATSMLSQLQAVKFVFLCVFLCAFFGGQSAFIDVYVRTLLSQVGFRCLY